MGSIILSYYSCIIIVTDLINVLPGNSSVNTVQHATTEEAVFLLDPTSVPSDWLDSDGQAYDHSSD
jgi:hypothetical protein